MNQKTRHALESLATFVQTVDDANALPREAGEFVHAMILATGATRAVEIGTSYGYSTLWIASALTQTGGRLISIDRDARKTQATRATLEAAGVGSVVDLITGDALEVLASLDGPFDFALSDADKENCIRYVELLTGKLSERAVVLTDNTRTHAKELATFVAWMDTTPDFHAIDVPVGNGMNLAVKTTAEKPS